MKSMLSVELAYVQSSGFAYLKCGSSKFAMFDSESEELVFFCEQEDEAPPLVYGSFLEKFASYVLIDAKNNGAKLTTTDQICYCEIGDFTESGATYVEAALKALTIFKNHKSQILSR